MYPEFRRILYHGTVSEITRVDVGSGRDRKDFGKGFYMAVSKSQEAADRLVIQLVPVEWG